MLLYFLAGSRRFWRVPADFFWRVGVVPFSSSFSGSSSLMTSATASSNSSAKPSPSSSSLRDLRFSFTSSMASWITVSRSTSSPFVLSAASTIASTISAAASSPISSSFADLRFSLMESMASLTISAMSSSSLSSSGSSPSFSSARAAFTASLIISWRSPAPIFMDFFLLAALRFNLYLLNLFPP